MQKLYKFFIYFSYVAVSISLFGNSSSEKITLPVAISAGKSNFKAKLNQLFLETAYGKRPTLSRGPTIFVSDIMIYDENKGIGYAYGNLRFADINDRIFMSAQEGTYYAKEEKIILRKVPEILVEQSEFISTRINGKIITVYPNEYYIHVQGNIEIDDGETLISGKQAQIWTKKDRMIVSGDVQAETSEQILTTDRLNVQFKNGSLDYYTAIGNVKAISKVDRFTLLSQFLTYRHTNGFFRATDEPSIYFHEQETIAHANVIEYYRETQEGSLLGDVITLQGDKSQKAFSRWALYSGKENKIRMLGNPRLEQNSSQLFGTEIIVNIDSNNMEILGGGRGFLDRLTQ
ncbi:hypothetical protein SAMN02745150_01156 [Brevinema andersonii]|uniref:Organic solvent tolerance-like N-terminal domain-containing protein n=1 Tax=Brevinema andersonii TaxID=34097 RepID=A0A1I1EKW8_BREAD|nr:LptA/OstA family protein [Brevinema andersonii]SFB87711.1 hypothetical protein SAMN02745150_01156 [Brevinema andersonii]